jgi:hypothetical protein
MTGVTATGVTATGVTATRRRCAVAAVALGLAGSVAFAGCGSNSTVPQAVPVPPGPTSSFRVPAPAPDAGTAAGVAVLALTQIFSWRPAAEQPGASPQRARRWLGPHLLAVLDQPPTGVEIPKPSLQWSDWAAKGAIINAFAFASGEQAPAPAATGAGVPTRAGSSTSGAVRRELVKIGIEQTAVYPDGHREQLPPMTVIATVVLTSDGWLLDDYR